MIGGNKNKNAHNKLEIKKQKSTLKRQKTNANACLFHCQMQLPSKIDRCLGDCSIAIVSHSCTMQQ
jgi:hypothetical protein